MVKCREILNSESFQIKKSISYNECTRMYLPVCIDSIKSIRMLDLSNNEKKMQVAKNYS